MPRSPNVVFDRYITHLKNKRVPSTRFDEYRKWLRFFLDFCDKNPVPANKAEKVRLFCEKLKGKKQTEERRKHAAHAVSLNFEMPENRVATLTNVSPANPDRMSAEQSYYVFEEAPRYSNNQIRGDAHKSISYCKLTGKKLINLWAYPLGS